MRLGAEKDRRGEGGEEGRKRKWKEQEVDREEARESDMGRKRPWHIDLFSQESLRDLVPL